MDITEIADTDTIVLFGGVPYDFQGETAKIVEYAKSLIVGDGVFEHTSKRTGSVTLVKVVPGMTMQVMTGKVFKAAVREQNARAMAMQPAPSGPMRRM